MNTSNFPELIDQPVIIDHIQGHRYIVEIGRFSDKSANAKKEDVSFCNSIKIYYYTTKLTDTYKLISDEFVRADSLYETKNVDWSNFATGLSPLGWRTGYVSVLTNEDGTLNVKYNYPSPYYISTPKIVYYIPDSNVISIDLQCPTGYGISAFEFDSSDNYIIRHGGGTSIRDNTTSSISFNVKAGNKYKFTIGRFNNQDAEAHLTQEFISQITLIEKRLKNTSLMGHDVIEYKKKTGVMEFFTIDIDTPIQYGNDLSSELTTKTIECVLRLPDSYSYNGKPTRLVLACHGASGYISSSANKWYNDNWQDFMDYLNEAGYATFDANVLPTTEGTNIMGYALGSPLYISILKKAYDYIIFNYNVYDKIFVHGTSMGGVGATAFASVYPYLVLAESSYAGRDLSQYLGQLYLYNTQNEDIDERYQTIFEYGTMEDLNDDHFSHIQNANTLFSLKKYNNGVLQYPPDRITQYSDWLNYYAHIQNYNQNDIIGDYTAYRSVPYMSWDSWNDNEQRTKARLILQKAYINGGSAPYICNIYDDLTHTQLSYGLIDGMRENLVQWYKRWE